MVTVVQSSEYTKNHGSVHFKIVQVMIFMSCDFYLNKSSLKKKSEFSVSGRKIPLAPDFGTWHFLLTLTFEAYEPTEKLQEPCSEPRRALH